MASTRSSFTGLSGAGVGMCGRDTTHDYLGWREMGSGFGSDQDALRVGILALALRESETSVSEQARSALSISDERLWVNIKCSY